MLSRPSPGSDPGPVQVPCRFQRGPVHIRHVLCFAAFRTSLKILGFRLISAKISLFRTTLAEINRFHTEMHPFQKVQIRPTCTKCCCRAAFCCHPTEALYMKRPPFLPHPGLEVGAIPARPGPILVPSVPSRIGSGRAEKDFLATSELLQNYIVIPTATRAHHSRHALGFRCAKAPLDKDKSTK